MGYYKDVPFVEDSDTSKAAAVSMASVAGGFESLVFEYIRKTGWHGATSDEACAALNLTHQNGSARVSTLAKKGLIVRSDRKRKTRSGRAAYVYVVGETNGNHSGK